MKNKPQTKYILIGLAPVIFALLFLIGDTVTRIVIGVILLINILLLIMIIKKEKDQKGFEEILTKPPVREDEHDLFDSGAVVVKGVYRPPADEPPVVKFAQTVSEVKDSSKRTNVITLSTDDNTGISDRYLEITNESAPKIENNKATISFFLDKTIRLIKEHLFAHSAVFYWVNPAAQKLTPAAYLAGVHDFKAMAIPIGSDLLSQVVNSERPVCITSIKGDEEAGLIKYYNDVHGIKSFAAVPVFYDKKVIAVLAVDSKDEEEFGSETLFTLGKYVRLITHVLSIVQTGFLEGLAEKRLKVMNNIVDQLLLSSSVEDILGVFEQRLRELIPAKVVSFLEYDSYSKSLKVLRVFKTDEDYYIPEGSDVEISNTLAGTQLSNPGPLYYKNLAEEDLPRYLSTEQRPEKGSFFTVPLYINSQLLGMLCFESPENNAFSTAEIRFVARLNSLVSYVFYNYSLQLIIKEQVSNDPETKTLNRKFYEERVEAELFKLKANNLHGSMILTAIDKFPEQMELFGNEMTIKPYKLLADFIRLETNPSMTVGKLDKDLYGIFFFGSDARDTYMWAERLKNKVAKQSTNAMGNGNGFTISVGLAPAENKSDYKELFQSASLALLKAQEGTGSKVVTST